jgi:tRNA 5-methylaminomethyl-2-thiouridine biosynthesis bifunctional protein
MEFFEFRGKRDLYSLKYNDVYWSQDGGWSEKNYVFLDSVGISEKWAGKEVFSILELGFGGGINFLATRQKWRDSKLLQRKLNYISIEQNPLPRTSLESLYNSLEIDTSLYDDFLNKYISIEKGNHTLSFPNDSLDLHLEIGEVLHILKNLNIEVDLIFLDGFSPSKNPDMWSLEIFQELFRICKTNGIFTTYSTASIVKENAVSSGFEIEKIKGFSKKKWMLHGFKKDNSKKVVRKPYFSFINLSRSTNTDAIVIGGGLAGTAIARALSEKGNKVTLIERENNLAKKTSGNPAGIINPNITVDVSSISKIELNAYFHLQRVLNEYKNDPNFKFGSNGVFLSSSDTDFERQMRGIKNHSLSSDIIFPHTEKDFNKEGFLLTNAGWIDPTTLCTTNINHQLENKIELIFNSNVLRIKNEDNEWKLSDDKGNEYKSDILVIANSVDSNQFEVTNWLPIRKFRGQIIYLTKDIFPYTLNHVYILDDCYLIPQSNYTILGATYEKDGDNLEVSIEDTKKLINRITEIFSLSSKIEYETIKGRVGIRVTTPDHLPIIGPVPDIDFFNKEYHDLSKGGNGIGLKPAKYFNGLYLFTGFGSKGILLTNYLAEVLAKVIGNEYTGLPNEVLESILPSRFIVRRLMKRKGY